MIVSGITCKFNFLPSKGLAKNGPETSESASPKDQRVEIASDGEYRIAESLREQTHATIKDLCSRSPIR
jgi:hypothetical protein